MRLIGAQPLLGGQNADRLAGGAAIGGVVGPPAAPLIGARIGSAVQREGTDEIEIHRPGRRTEDRIDGVAVMIVEGEVFEPRIGAQIREGHTARPHRCRARIPGMIGGGIACAAEDDARAQEGRARGPAAIGGGVVIAVGQIGCGMGALRTRRQGGGDGQHKRQPQPLTQTADMLPETTHGKPPGRRHSSASPPGATGAGHAESRAQLLAKSRCGGRATEVCAWLRDQGIVPIWLGVLNH